MHTTLLALLLFAAPPCESCPAYRPAAGDVPRWVASPHLCRRHPPIHGNYYRADYDYRVTNDYPWFLWPHVPRHAYVAWGEPFHAAAAPLGWSDEAELVPPGAAWPSPPLGDPRIKRVWTPSPPPVGGSR